MPYLPFSPDFKVDTELLHDSSKGQWAVKVRCPARAYPLKVPGFLSAEDAQAAAGCLVAWWRRSTGAEATEDLSLGGASVSQSELERLLSLDSWTQFSHHLVSAFGRARARKYLASEGGQQFQQLKRELEQQAAAEPQSLKLEVLQTPAGGQRRARVQKTQGRKRALQVQKLFKAELAALGPVVGSRLRHTVQKGQASSGSTAGAATSSKPASNTLAQRAAAAGKEAAEAAAQARAAPAYRPS